MDHMAHHARDESQHKM